MKRSYVRGPPIIEGVDYSWARPSPTGLYTAGKRFACRYVSSSTRIINGVTKNLSKAEADALHAAGVATVTNWEWTEDDWTHGYTTGQEYARRAKQMHADCGGPGDRPIYFSVDRDLGGYPAASVDACRQYFAGIRSVLGKARVGIYGGRYAVRLAHDEGWCDWFWQTYAWSNIATLGWLPYTHIQQYNNGETVAGTPGIDLDRATVADYGQWGADDMYTDADRHKLDNLYLAVFAGGESCGTIVDVGDGRPPNNSIINKLDYLIARGGTIPSDVMTLLTQIGDTVTALPTAQQTAKAVADEDHARSAQ